VGKWNLDHKLGIKHRRNRAIIKILKKMLKQLRPQKSLEIEIETRKQAENF
jgi:hypothetical protein